MYVSPTHLPVVSAPVHALQDGRDAEEPKGNVIVPIREHAIQGDIPECTTSDKHSRNLLKELYFNARAPLLHLYAVQSPPRTNQKTRTTPHTPDVAVALDVLQLGRHARWPAVTKRIENSRY